MKKIVLNVFKTTLFKTCMSPAPVFAQHRFQLHPYSWNSPRNYHVSVTNTVQSHATDFIVEISIPKLLDQPLAHHVQNFEHVLAAQ
jgi:hypothetical protein